jgi:hypothetical protein
LTEEKIRAWFTTAAIIIDRIPGGTQALHDPTRVFNADESGFALDANTGKVKKIIARKGARHVYRRSQSDKTQITVQACCNAAGLYQPPFFIFPGKRLTPHIGYKDFPEAHYALSDNGWMDTEVFKWFVLEFDKFVTEAKICKPVILFLDGHVSHLGVETARYCRDHGIILYAFIPNATYVIQPFDVGVFSELKHCWGQEVRKFNQENFNVVIDKGNFPKIFKGAWAQVTTKEIAKSAFRRSGIYPFDANNVEFDRLVKTDPAPEAAATPAPAPVVPVPPPAPRPGTIQMTLQISPEGVMSIVSPDRSINIKSR